MELARPDGARIHYEVRGDGPVVVLSLGFAATPATYAGLAADLARDHTVVTWDPRGCGRSGPEGPFAIATDAGDLLALVEAVGGPAVLYGAGHGVSVSIHAGRAAPAAVSGIATPGVVQALRGHLAGSEGFGASPQVIEMLVEQLRHDPRGATRATISSLNPQLDEEALRARVDETLAYSPVDATLARIESWQADEGALEAAGALGDRLVVIWHRGDDWQAGAIERVRDLLPDARLVEVEDGPLSRPDLAADAVREMT